MGNLLMGLHGLKLVLLCCSVVPPQDLPFIAGCRADKFVKPNALRQQERHHIMFYDIECETKMGQCLLIVFAIMN